MMNPKGKMKKKTTEREIKIARRCCWAKGESLRRKWGCTYLMTVAKELQLDTEKSGENRDIGKRRIKKLIIIRGKGATYSFQGFDPRR
jgi:hypothetical protein